MFLHAVKKGLAVVVDVDARHDAAFVRASAAGPMSGVKFRGGATSGTNFWALEVVWGTGTVAQENHRVVLRHRRVVAPASVAHRFF